MSTNQHAVLPPPYEPNGNRDPSQPVPATNLPGQPGQPIAMQPMGEPGMKPGAGQTVTPLHLLSERAEWIDCQMCHQRTKTRVETTGEGMQFLTGALLCLVCICLAPLPCCLHWFEQTNWYCTGCGKQVATRNPESPVHVLPPPHALSVPSQYAAQGQQPPPQVNPQAGSPPPQGQPQQPWPQQSPPPQGQQQQPYPGTPGSPPVPAEHQQHASPQIAQAQHQQQQYGQQPYGQPPYGQPEIMAAPQQPYGQPQYGSPEQLPTKN